MTKEKVLKALSDISADIEQGFGLRAKRKIFDLFVGLSFTPFPSRWISVDEKLPEMDEEVIVLTDELSLAIYKISFGHIVDKDYAMDWDGWNIPGVKYWMPCPEIPNND